MSDFLNNHTVLVLNSLYQAIGTLSPKKALITLNSSYDQINPAARAIDVIYGKNENGEIDIHTLDYWQPLCFEEWMMVEPRPNIDNVIHTSKIQLRCPTVIITNYSKMPMRKFRPTKSTLYAMQNGICGYSGEKISLKQGSIEHKTPRSYGGRDTFENLMMVKKEINHRRGNKPLEELGLKPLFNHRTPQPMPATYTIRHLGHPDWQWFVNQS